MSKNENRNVKKRAMGIKVTDSLIFSKIIIFSEMTPSALLKVLITKK